MAKRKGRRPRAKWHLGGPKAKLSKKRKHKPVALLELYHRKMMHNVDKLEGLIARRKAAGE
jgi:hypothetical protein